MENNVKIIKKVKSKIYDRYNWASISTGAQMLLATGFATVLELGLLVYFMVIDGEGDFFNTMVKVNEYALVIAGVSYILANLISTYGGLKFSKTCKMTELIRKPQFGALDITLGVLAVLGVSGIDSMIMSALNVIFDSSSKAVEATLTSGLYSDKLWVVICSLAYIAVLGPITEEMLFRGTALATTSHISPKVGIVASALLFGLMHGNITQLYNAFLLGILLGYIALKSKSIIPAVIAHVTNNTFAVITQFISDSMGESAGKTFDWVFNALVGVIGIVAIIFLIKRNGDIDDSKDKYRINMPVPQEYMDQVVTPANPMKFKTFFSTWAFWCVVAYAVVNSILIIYLGRNL